MAYCHGHIVRQGAPVLSWAGRVLVWGLCSDLDGLMIALQQHQSGLRLMPTTSNLAMHFRARLVVCFLFDGGLSRASDPGPGHGD